MNGQAMAKRHYGGWQNLRDDRNLVFLAERTRGCSEQLTFRLDALKQALDDGDSDTWSELARDLTETTTRFGAIRMMKLCIALQMQGRRNLITKARETFDELTSEFVRFKENLMTAES